MYVAIFSCSNNESNIETTTSFYKPSGVISQEKAVNLSEAWQTKTLLKKSGVKTEGNQEIQSNWWSLEDIRNYLDYTEHEAQEKGFNMTGVRVYFGAYSEKGNQNTMFFAPTGNKNISQANMLNMSFFRVEDKDLPVDPLNGGDGGYPD